MPVVGRAPLAAGCSGRASPGKAKPHPLDGALLAYGQPFPSSLQLITSKRRPIQGGACLGSVDKKDTQLKIKTLSSDRVYF